METLGKCPVVGNSTKGCGEQYKGWGRCPVMGRGTVSGIGTGDPRPNFPFHGPPL